MNKLINQIIDYLEILDKIKICKHQWIYDKHNSYIRDCSKCNAHQMMYMKRFPNETEPSLSWK